MYCGEAGRTERYPGLQSGEFGVQTVSELSGIKEERRKIMRENAINLFGLKVS